MIHEDNIYSQRFTHSQIGCVKAKDCLSGPTPSRHVNLLLSSSISRIRAVKPKRLRHGNHSINTPPLHNHPSHFIVLERYESPHQPMFVRLVAFLHPFFCWSHALRPACLLSQPPQFSHRSENLRTTTTPGNPRPDTKKRKDGQSLCFPRFLGLES